MNQDTEGHKDDEDSGPEDKRQHDCGQQTSLQGRKYPPKPKGTIEKRKKNQVWALHSHPSHSLTAKIVCV